uniref:Uncharacterized protein n=1 Tax=Rhizophora mucronata TaxID=61149 RepID=A0A2P2KI01_RHIMU
MYSLMHQLVGIKAICMSLLFLSRYPCSSLHHICLIPRFQLVATSQINFLLKTSLVFSMAMKFLILMSVSVCVASEIHTFLCWVTNFYLHIVVVC